MNGVTCLSTVQLQSIKASHFYNISEKQIRSNEFHCEGFLARDGSDLSLEVIANGSPQLPPPPVTDWAEEALGV